jgi:hypothetical protein
MPDMNSPRIKPSAFFRRGRRRARLSFVPDRWETKLGGVVENLAAMQELVDFGAVVAQVDARERGAS